LGACGGIRGKERAELDRNPQRGRDRALGGPVEERVSRSCSGVKETGEKKSFPPTGARQNYSLPNTEKKYMLKKISKERQPEKKIIKQHKGG